MLKMHDVKKWEYFIYEHACVRFRSPSPARTAAFIFSSQAVKQVMDPVFILYYFQSTKINNQMDNLINNQMHHRQYQAI